MTDNYMGRFTNSLIVDYMLETILDRGYKEADMKDAVAGWLESDGERLFWEQVLGPAVDRLEEALDNYGLTMEPTCDICEEPQTCCDDCDPEDWNGKTGNHKSCEAEEARESKPPTASTLTLTLVTSLEELKDLAYCKPLTVRLALAGGIAYSRKTIAYVPGPSGRSWQVHHHIDDIVEMLTETQFHDRTNVQKAIDAKALFYETP